MASGQTGYQPRTSPAERRAFFEHQRQLDELRRLIRIAATEQLPYRWSNSTTMDDPGQGTVRVNNATPSSATQLVLSGYDSNGTVRLSVLGMTLSDEIAIYESADLSHWIKYKVSADPTNTANTWVLAPVVLVDVSPDGFAPANNEPLQVIIRDATVGEAGTIDWTQGYPTYDPRYVNVAGDTMTGDLVLAADPDAAMEATTKQYVDGQVATRLTEAQVDARVTAVGDPRYVNVAGDAMTEALDITAAVEALKLRRAGSDSPHMGWYLASGTRGAYIQLFTGEFRVAAESGKDLGLYAGGTEKARILDSGSVLVGKTASSATVNGFEIAQSGRFQATTTTGTAVNGMTNITNGANSDQHFSFRRNNTPIGSISQATTSTVAYNTSSDEDLKTNIVEIDDELAEWVARVVQPYLFEYKIAPGDVHPGYIAQRVAAMWPESIILGIVTPGHGDINDRTFDDDGNETTPEGVWSQWQMDYSKMTPIIHAAWQSSARKLDALTARVEALEAAGAGG